VLRPGGTLAILEFSQPTNRAFAVLYNFFSVRVLPWIGGIVSGSSEAYKYLPESIARFRAPRSWKNKCAPPASQKPNSSA